MTAVLVTSATAMGITAMLCLAALRAWRGWLDLRHFEVAQRASSQDSSAQEVGLRIELAAVKERLKKLEAIASGVEL